jgi:carbamoyltransferase
MNILGIHTGHNATAALILNNKLQAAISEEKFLNIKNYDGFPLNAINFLMKNYNLSADNIDYVAIAGYVNYTFLPTEERIKKIKNQKSGDFNVGVFYATMSQLITTYFNFSNEIFYNFYSFYKEKIKIPKNQKALIELLNKLYGFRKSQIGFKNLFKKIITNI